MLWRVLPLVLGVLFLTSGVLLAQKDDPEKSKKKDDVEKIKKPPMLVGPRGWEGRFVPGPMIGPPCWPARPYYPGPYYSRFRVVSHPVTIHHPPPFVVRSHRVMSYPVCGSPMHGYPVFSGPVLSYPMHSHPMPSYPMYGYPIGPCGGGY